MDSDSPTCPHCGRSSDIESARDAYEGGTFHQTVTEWRTVLVPTGKNGEMAPYRRSFDRVVVRQTDAARRLSPPEPPSGSAAAEPLGCSIVVVGGALWFAAGNRDGTTLLVVIGIIALCLRWVAAGFKADQQCRQWWQETGHAERQRKLAVLQHGWYCHNCDESFS